MRPIPPPPPDREEIAANRRRVFSCGCIGCAGLFFFFGMGLLLIGAIPNPVVLAIAGLAAILPVPTYTFLVLQLDRYEHEPWQALLAAFLWGALVATFIAAIFNDLIGSIVTQIVGDQLGDMLTTSAVAPIVEETAKGFALLLLYWMLRHEFDNVLDGIVYGSLVGIGFAMTENILYFGRTLQENGPIGLGVLFYLRVMLGGFGHALYTGTIGAGLGFARETHRRWLVPILIPGAYILGILQHAAWNFLGATVVPAVLGESADPVTMLFVIMPLTMLSGTFYPIGRLPEPFVSISHFNPFFQLIDGFRFGFTGHAESDLLFGGLMSLGVTLVLCVVCWSWLSKGYKLKA